MMPNPGPASVAAAKDICRSGLLTAAEHLVTRREHGEWDKSAGGGVRPLDHHHAGESASAAGRVARAHVFSELRWPSGPQRASGAESLLGIMTLYCLISYPELEHAGGNEAMLVASAIMGGPTRGSAGARPFAYAFCPGPPLSPLAHFFSTDRPVPAGWRAPSGFRSPRALTHFNAYARSDQRWRG